MSKKNLFGKELTRLFMALKEKAFENIEGKGENAGNQHFLLFPPCFPPYEGQVSSFGPHVICRLKMLPIWTSLKFCRFGKGLDKFR